MAHFAQLNENNVVIQVIVISNDNLMHNGAESEAKGIAFCQSLFGPNTRWVQTSYNNKFRRMYAGVNCIYDATLNAFLPPKPEGEEIYAWNEEAGNWVAVPKE